MTARVTAELGRPGHPVAGGPARHRVRLLDHHASPPRLLATLTVVEAAELRKALAEAVEQARAEADHLAVGGHEPGG